MAISIPTINNINELVNVIENNLLNDLTDDETSKLFEMKKRLQRLQERKNGLKEEQNKIKFNSKMIENQVEDIESNEVEEHSIHYITLNINGNRDILIALKNTLKVYKDCKDKNLTQTKIVIKKIVVLDDEITTLELNMYETFYDYLKNTVGNLNNDFVIRSDTIKLTHHNKTITTCKGCILIKTFLEYIFRTKDIIMDFEERYKYFNNFYNISYGELTRKRLNTMQREIFCMFDYTMSHNEKYQFLKDIDEFLSIKWCGGLKTRFQDFISDCIVE
jgi:hypothetical protein